MHESSPLFVALAAGLALVASAPKVGADEQCRGVQVNAAANLSEAWANAVRDLSAQIPANGDGRCVAMTLLVEPAENDSAKLSATARDGRHADRIVPKPSALGSMALGLIASLPPDAPAPPENAPPKTEASAPATAASAAPASSSPAASSSAASSSSPPIAASPPAENASSLSPEIWLGGGLGARVAEPSEVGMLDLEARGDLEVRHWLLVISFRYGSSIGETLTPADAEYEETVVGLGVGRTIAIGKTQLSLAIIPSFAAVNIDDDDDANGSNGSRSTVRIGASVKWSVPLDKWWRFTITADSDFSPRSFAHEVYVDPSLPPLPAWTGGFRLGASGKLL
jgi:hypothetical protein